MGNTRLNRSQCLHSLRHGTSSTFSSSGNPDDDWTKISDRTKRRRIQNRIAQRKYRKKIKNRREELERRVRALDDTSASGNQTPNLPTKTKRTQTPEIQSQLPSAQAAPGRYTPPVRHGDESVSSASYNKGGWSHTRPMSTYSTYMPAPEEVTYPEYLSLGPVSASLSLVTHSSDPISQETGYQGSRPVDEDMPPYMSYSGYPLPGVDLSSGQPSTWDEIPYAAPLSHLYDHWAAGPNSGSCDASPITPLSTDGSPSFV